MATFKVLIIGAGIAGPSLALWLARLNGRQGVEFAVTIVERTATLRAQGQQIDLRGQGVTVMRHMGLEQRVREKVVNEEGVLFVNKAGKRMAVIEPNKSGKGRQSLTSEFEIMRGDLVRIFYDVTKENTKYIFDTTVTKLEDIEGDQVKVTFSNGSQDTFDLVVGADGQNSRTRRIMPGADTTDPFVSLGVYMALFTIPRTKDDTNYGTIHHMSDRRSIFTRADNPKTVQCGLHIMRTSKHAAAIEATRKAPLPEQKKAWAAAFKDSTWQGSRFIDALFEPLADDFYVYEVGQVKTRAWSKGRVVLLGDAAFCPSPFTGFGTSLAMVGAYVLAGELSQHVHDGRITDVPAALGAYDRAMRPFVEEVQHLPPGIPWLFYLKTELGIWLLHTIIWLVVTLRIHKIVLMFSSDDMGTWKLPRYQNLGI
jgi:2-polyprenyl-6-methoxyphenol hydroxylase-like FAD-dependent oxidoreductase